VVLWWYLGDVGEDLELVPGRVHTVHLALIQVYPTHIHKKTRAGYSINQMIMKKEVRLSVQAQG
jgi:hypothetical protein